MGMRQVFNGWGTVLREAFGPPLEERDFPPPVQDVQTATKGLHNAAAHLRAVAHLVAPDLPSDIAGEPAKRDTLENALRRLSETSSRG